VLPSPFRSGSSSYQPGGDAALSELVLTDRSGHELESLGAPALYYQPRLSHSGRSLAVDITDPQSAAGDLWLLDVTRKVSTRLTHDPVNETNPLWSPDDRELFYYHDPDIWRRPASGGGDGRPVLQSAIMKRPTDLSGDGRFVLFLAYDRGQLDIELLSVADGKISPWQATPFNENGARFSPDGRWVAYVSDETGRHEVYVRSFDGSGATVLVSSGGGGAPVWRSDGKELYYVTPDDRLVAVPIRIGAHLETGLAQPLFELRTRSWFGHAQYDVTPDGQRFVLNRLVSDKNNDPLTVVVDWAAGLGR
jgi:Tol biopolymer transport system component